MKHVLLIVAAAALTACGPDPVQQQYAPQPQVIYQQAPVQQAPVIVQQDNNAANLAAGIAIGSMLNNSNSYRPPETRYIERRTTIIKEVPAAPAVAAAPAAPAKPSFVTPTPAPVAQAAKPSFVTPAPAAPSFAPKTTYVQAAPKVTYSAPAAKPAPSYAPKSSSTTQRR